METVDLSPQSAVSPTTGQAELFDSVSGNLKQYEVLHDVFHIIDRKNPQVNQNMAMIWEWARRNSEDTSKDAIVRRIMTLKNRLGDVVGNSAPYAKLVSYISSDNAMMRRLQAEKEYLDV